jgi:hypothetical protein
MAEKLKNNILKTLLYYDIFSHPLKDEEIFTFLPENSVTKDYVYNILKESAGKDETGFAEKDGYYYVKPNEKNVCRRKSKESYSRRMWKAAWWVTHIIKRFPYVRSVLITGSLSKNSSDESSDLDFMVITEKGRLWIARTMLMLFKKIFLFNSKKYFCINYFITDDYLEIEDKNFFTATEVAHIKATYNTSLMNRFIEANLWIKKHFPNYVLLDPALHTAGCRTQNRRSILQIIAEALVPKGFAEKTDIKLMNKMIEHWNKKYSYIEESERNYRLRSTRTVSKSHPNSVHKVILDSYTEKLRKFNLPVPE